MEKASWIRKMFEQGAKLKKEYGDANVFDFSIGNPYIDPPEKFFETLERVAKDRTRGVHGYMSNAGYPETRDAVARISDFTADDSNVVKIRLQAGQGIICNNVLHNRSEFTDSDTQKRLMYRARYYDAVNTDCYKANQ